MPLDIDTLMKGLPNDGLVQSCRAIGFRTPEDYPWIQLPWQDIPYMDTFCKCEHSQVQLSDQVSDEESWSLTRLSRYYLIGNATKKVQYNVLLGQCERCGTLYWAMPKPPVK